MAETKERVAFINQKRTGLVQQLKDLQQAIETENFDLTQASLRLERVTALFHGYEELHDELFLLDPAAEGLDQLGTIQNSYYTVASKIKDQQTSKNNANGDVTLNPRANSTIFELKKTHKLPVAPLPKFYGDHNDWLSFSNTFLSMIDERDDITDLVKLTFLKECVQGKAAKKIAHILIASENYKVAWNLLKESYEKKRIVVSKHLDAIINISAPTKVTAESLSDIVNAINQNQASLKNLEVELDERFTVRHVELILPDSIREEWEKSLTSKELPTIKQLCDFLNSVISRLESMQKASDTSKRDSNNKRPNPFNAPRSFKAHKGEKGERTLLTKSSGEYCLYCKEDHWIHKCPKFQQLNIQARWDAVRSKQLCRNCLRKHPFGKCGFNLRCKSCGKNHHSLLHNENWKKSPSASVQGTRGPTPQ